ncbi:ABC transporter (plasmid) [Halobiforma lacisalsi AJ5]|uniref:ABC transporter n=1 Tax=Natronobacterium lacisalsi AJ5 TaxID=358396 RepID=M0L930_NATLA|nr:ABC transporter ATP-binding protein [Halobiforma lacisalsi]APX00246.1 ABC transporter [Halobiforma lacisalsi AJ5]EMA30061.1 ABC transporter [Halobiforma lacisalsi AJ5]
MVTEEQLLSDHSQDSLQRPVREQSDDPIVTVSGLEKVYGKGDDAVEAVKGVDFDIQPETVVGILGHNGAGKTTVIKSILALIVPTSGTVTVDGIDVHENTSAAYEKMGAMLEGARNTYWRLTVRENLEIFSVIAGNDYRKNSARIDELIAQFKLGEKEDTPVRELSRGQKQKVSLACTMVRDTDVVFLDEPTLGLDVESSRKLRRELRRLADHDGRTVLLSSHDMDVIEDVCDRVIIMNQGRIIADDTVDNLIELFNTQMYEVVIEGRLDAGSRRQLESNFVLKNVEERPETTKFEAQITGEEFYNLVGTLERAGVTIDSITDLEPDFDEIFLRLSTDRSHAEGVKHS